MIMTTIMTSRKTKNGRNGMKFALACAAIGWMCWNADTVCQAQTAPAALSPGLQHVVNLSKGGMSDDFILTYITNSGTAFTLSDDDIIYLHKQGVSDNVIKSLIQTAAPASPPPTAPAANANSGAASATPTPPPLDAGPGAPSATPAPDAPSAPAPAVAPVMPPPAAAPLQDSFFSDAVLNPALWTTQSGVLSALASMNGAQVYPRLGFSLSGMEMSGVGGPAQWMGIQSTASFAPPFTFSATVSGLAQRATPFEIYLVSGDLQQWVSIAGHLGGRGQPHGEVIVGGVFGHIVHGDVGVPVGGGNAPDYGVWVNHTGSGLPISALGYKLLRNPLAGVPYTFQITAGPDGSASVALLNSVGTVLATQNVPVGTGPFYVVLAGRDGRTVAEWQSVQLIPAAPPVAVEAAPEAAPAPAPPTLDYFQSQLAPYGNWVTVPGYGLCWQPAVNPGWRPYYDGGNWTYSDDGWYWQSDYPWGDIAFHYGRWAYTAAGWVWVPGYDYAPAWVVWRHADDDGYVGWAPLPPGAVFVDGGWAFNGVRVGVDFDFDLGAGFFTFVGYDHFWDHDFRQFIVPRDRLALVYRRSVFENHYRLDHGRFINEGLNRDRMAAFTHHDIRPMAAQDLRRQEESRNVQARSNDLHDFKPDNTRPNATRPVEKQSSPSRPQSGGGNGNNNRSDQRP
jgi:hypothetical protein